MKLVLEERGVDTRKMKADDMRIVLGNHHDFKHGKTALEYFLHEKHQRLIYLPKFHCELTPIERVRGEAKRYTRAHCDYSFPGLEKNIIPALESVKLTQSESTSENVGNIWKHIGREAVEENKWREKLKNINHIVVYLEL